MISQRQIFSRTEWLQWRKSYLTASDIGAAAGLDDYKSRLRLWAEKSNMVPDVQETGAMRRGRLFESAALAYLAEEHPLWLIERPAVFYADDINRMGATPDALISIDGETINCQIKTISLPVFERWEGSPPLKYQLQVCAENLLTQADRGLLVVLVVSAFDAFVQVFDVPRHAAAEARIAEIAKDFWAAVDSGKPPAADYSQDRDTLAALFPPRPEVPVPLDLSTDNRVQEILAQREQWKTAEKGAKAAADAIDAELVEKLDGAELALAPGWRITRKMQHRNEHVVPASDFPVLKITKQKDDAP